MECKDREVMTYLLKAGSNYKIGITDNLEHRLNGIQNGNPYEVNVIDFNIWLSREVALFIESSLFTKFVDKRLKGEWFKLDAEDVLFIQMLFNNGLTEKSDYKDKLKRHRLAERNKKYSLDKDKLTVKDAVRYMHKIWSDKVKNKDGTMTGREFDIAFKNMAKWVKVFKKEAVELGFTKTGSKGKPVIYTVKGK
jgi:hypothetical protein